MTLAVRSKQVAWIALAVLSAGAMILGLGIATSRALDAIMDCSPPSQRELQEQEAFVRAHVSDASDVEVGAADCDDYGAGYVYFKTKLTPQAARDAFLADNACSSSADGGVECKSAGFTVWVGFEAEDSGWTSGELNMDPE